jgi:hypothetical protein
LGKASSVWLEIGNNLFTGGRCGHAPRFWILAVNSRIFHNARPFAAIAADASSILLKPKSGVLHVNNRHIAN